MPRRMTPHSILVLALVAGVVQAQEPTYEFNLPPQPVSQVLATLAKQTGLNVSYPRDAVKGIQSPGVKGRYPLKDALALGLSGTGLTFEFTGEKAVRIQSAKADAGKVVEIWGEADNGYTVRVATTATKTDTPLLETPSAIQVIPQQVLQDQKATTLDFALVNVSGVRSSNIGWAENLILRGFSTYTHFRNGFRVDDPSGLNGTTALGDVESIEILKGPASILYGRVEPGGVVNLVTKQPKEAAQFTFEQSAGSWNHLITSLDATGPLNDDRTLLYRVNLSRDASDSWIDNVKERRLFVAPALTWKVSDATRITLEASYSKNDTTLYQQTQVPYDTTAMAYVWGPRNTNPAPYTFSPNTLFYGMTWSHDFNANWSIRQTLSHHQVNFTTPLNWSNGLGPLELDNGVWMLGLNTAKLAGRTLSDGTGIDLTGHFATGALQHTLLLGADGYRTEAGYDSKYSNINGPFFFVPNFSSSSPAPFLPLDPDTYAITHTLTTSWGIYLQDQIKLPGGLQLLLGLRRDHVSGSSWANYGVNVGGTGVQVANPDTSEGATTPRLALLWKATNTLSFYTSYSENFGASNASSTDWQGRPLKPEGARQLEVGLKAESRDGRRGLSLALFDLTKTNMTANDLAHPNGQGGFFPTTIGEVGSKGGELNLQGELAEGWNALLAYTHDLVKVKVGTSSYPEGTRLPFVPDQMLRLSTTYRVGHGPLEGLKLGGGVSWEAMEPGLYVDPDTGASATSVITSPAHTVWDAMASYEVKVKRARLTFQVNARNLFNASYYTDAFMYFPPFGYVTYGAPRSFLASVRVDF